MVGLDGCIEAADDGKSGGVSGRCAHDIKKYDLGCCGDEQLDESRADVQTKKIKFRLGMRRVSLNRFDDKIASKISKGSLCLECYQPHCPQADLRNFARSV